MSGNEELQSQANLLVVYCDTPVPTSDVVCSVCGLTQAVSGAWPVLVWQRPEPWNPEPVSPVHSSSAVIHIP